MNNITTNYLMRLKYKTVNWLLLFPYNKSLDDSFEDTDVDDSFEDTDVDDRSSLFFFFKKKITTTTIAIITTITAITIPIIGPVPNPSLSSEILNP